MAIFEFSFHNPNPWIDDYLHGDHTHTDDDGEEVVSPGTPDRPVVIEPEPEPDPAPAPDPEDDPRTLTGSEDESAYVVLVGGTGDDTLTGGSRALYNLLNGGDGDDTLIARGWGENVLIGGPGEDVFDMTHDSKAKIMDFQDGIDKIKITGQAVVGFYNAVQEAGLTWDMRWIATEQSGYNDDTLALEIEPDTNQGTPTIVTILDVQHSDLQFEVVGDDVFIV